MIDIVIECKGMRTQDFARVLLGLGPLKIWMHGSRAYARLTVKNMDELNALTNRLIGQKVIFSYVKIQMGDSNQE